MAGTRWVQRDLLEHYPTAKLHVYAIWFDMLASDARTRWPATLLTDPRVMHRWDEPKAAGHWFAQHASSMRPRLTPDSRWGNGDVLWDSWLLYGPTASWASSEAAPTDLVHWGRTIVASRETLKADFERLFGAPR